MSSGYLVISPFSRKLKSGKENAKNYPYWKELIFLLDGKKIIQVGIAGEEKIVEDCRFDLSISELKPLIIGCDTWISVDNFFPHFAHFLGKVGIVLWGKSDPRIFGHESNINLAVSEDCFRPNQFDLWDNEIYDPKVFVEPERVIEALNALIGERDVVPV